MKVYTVLHNIVNDNDIIPMKSFNSLDAAHDYVDNLIKNYSDEHEGEELIIMEEIYNESSVVFNYSDENEYIIVTTELDKDVNYNDLDEVNT